jgi:NAD(P)-dependent dehydrogenase (short-subunit alcohol dehydrogenase family)
VIPPRRAVVGMVIGSSVTSQFVVRRASGRLLSTQSIREFAAAWSVDLDILVNNAGIMLVPEGRTDDGFELQIAYPANPQR